MKIKLKELIYFIPSLCLCGCNETIWKKGNKYIHGHNRNSSEWKIGLTSNADSRIHKHTKEWKYCRSLYHPKKKVQGDFSYTIKCYCQCPCHQEIILNKEKFNTYECEGYPKYINGHNQKGIPKSEIQKKKMSENNWMKTTE